MPRGDVRTACREAGFAGGAGQADRVRGPDRDGALAWASPDRRSSGGDLALAAELEQEGVVLRAVRQVERRSQWSGARPPSEAEACSPRSSSSPGAMSRSATQWSSRQRRPGAEPDIRARRRAVVHELHAVGVPEELSRTACAGSRHAARTGGAAGRARRAIRRSQHVHRLVVPARPGFRPAIGRRAKTPVPWIGLFLKSTSTCQPNRAFLSASRADLDPARRRSCLRAAGSFSVCVADTPRLHPQC